VRLIGLAMQTSLRLQQHYSGLVARGDEVLTALRGDSQPGVATFDEDLPPTTATGDRPAPRSSAFDRAAELVEDPADDLTVELSDEIDEAPGDVEVGDVAAGTADVGLDELVADELLAEERMAEELLAEEVLAGEAAPPDDVAGDAPLADVLAFETLAAEAGEGISDAEVAGLPADPSADVITEAVDELAGEVDAELAAELPESVADEVADDLAADTVAAVADAEVGGSAPAGDVVALDEVTPDAAPEDVATLEEATPDVAALDEAAAELVDLGAAEPVVVQPDVAGAEGVPGVTGANVAAADHTTTQAPGTPAAPTEPVTGYDGFSIPTLRGRLRTFNTERVSELLDYERATQARAPYVTLLSNRLAKLSAPAS
jgi:hypothetical protein